MNFISVFKNLWIKFQIYRSDAFSVYRVYQKYYNVKFGKGVRITGKKISFGGEPYLVEIGDNVTITPGVKFQTHDGGVFIFRNEYPGINVYGKIKVGNNVFIGEDVMIMYGVTIGDNVVIGARSVVTKSIRSNCVVAGVPAKEIRTIDQYKENSLKKGIIVPKIGGKAKKFFILSQLNKL